MKGAARRLSARGLGVSVPGRVLCHDLDLDVGPGECCVVVGPNGAGKSTLLATLAGVRRSDSGAVAYDGAMLETLSPRERACKRSWLPQSQADPFPASVLETVLVGRHPHLPAWAWENEQDIATARAAIGAVGLGDLETREVGTLSGGERRRVAIAALIAQDADLMLLDEPSAHLDVAHQIAVLDLLTGLARERGRAIVMVLHDFHLALRYADSAVALGGGAAVAGPAAAILEAGALSRLFGHPLVEVGEGPMRTFLPAAAAPARRS